MKANKQAHIVQGLQAGDKEAWLMLYDAYARRVWENVARLVSDQAVVPDIVQETFLEAARSAHTYEAERGALWVWLWTIARRQMALYFRKQQRSVGLERLQKWWASLDGRKREMLENLEAPVNLLASQELGELVRHCLTRLDAEHQTLLMAKYLDEKSADSIAGQMNCSVVAVRSKLARARKAFRREFSSVTDIVPAVGS
ncbi:RNA polymerase sigma factor [Planctomycetota bacterium]